MKQLVSLSVTLIICLGSSAFGAGAEELVSQICTVGGRARYLLSLHAVTDHLVGQLAEGDLVLTMGAGDVWKVADELVERICEPNRA